MKVSTIPSYIVLALISLNPAMASEEALKLASNFCEQNNCDSTSAVQDAVSSPNEGTCFVISSGSVFKTISLTPSERAWWLLLSIDISPSDYNRAVDFSKKFTQSVKQQVYMAEPYKKSNFQKVVDKYCVAVFNEFSYSYQDPIGILLPKF